MISEKDKTTIIHFAKLFKHLSKPVDLVDLSYKSPFNQLIEEEGVKIYG